MAIQTKSWFHLLSSVLTPANSPDGVYNTTASDRHMYIIYIIYIHNICAYVHWKLKNIDTHTHVMKTIWCVHQAGRRSERGVLRFRTWCGLSHLGLTGLGGWVTTGHAAGGTQRPGFHFGTEKHTQPLYVYNNMSGCQGLRPGWEISACQTLVCFGCGGHIHPFCSKVHVYAFGATGDLVLGEKAFKGLSCRCMLGMETLSPLSRHSSSHKLQKIKSYFVPVD